MKFRPREPDGSVNVSKTSPVEEFLILTGGLIAVILCIWLALGVAASWIAGILPPDAEKWLGQQTLEHLNATPSPVLQARLDNLVRHLPPDSPLRQRVMQVYTVDSDTVNAVAVPGGAIVVFQGLLEQVESENELAMILGHELGHFAHKDHLKRFGRMLLLNAGLWLILGAQNQSNSFLVPLIAGLESSYSRSQEEAADLFGLELLVRQYGHTGGATDFFVNIERKNARPRLGYIFASHPHPEERIALLRSIIEERGYKTGPLIPLRPDVKALR